LFPQKKFTVLHFIAKKIVSEVFSSFSGTMIKNVKLVSQKKFGGVVKKPVFVSEELFEEKYFVESVF